MLVVFQYSTEDYERARQQYTGGTTIDEVIQCAKELNTEGWYVVINKLGEKNIDREQAYKTEKTYIELIERINSENLWAGISVKLTSLGLGLYNDLALNSMRRILTSAKEAEILVEIDMEYSALVDETINIYRDLVKEGFQLRGAVQTGLERTVKDVRRLFTLCRNGQGNMAFRIVTGSCYNKDGDGYGTTLEQNKRKTDSDFYELIKLTATNSNGLASSVGTFVKERIMHAAKYGLELHGLKGYEHTEGQRLMKELMKQGIVCAIYLPFGEKDRDYVKRRLDSEN